MNGRPGIVCPGGEVLFQRQRQRPQQRRGGGHHDRPIAQMARLDDRRLRRKPARALGIQYGQQLVARRNGA
jgi:hypothetical protein